MARMMRKAALLCAGLVALMPTSYGEQIHVAVAANFTAPMKAIAQSFERDTGHQAILSFGATGGFYAQIKNGGPYAILLAADDETPFKIENEGLGVPGSRFTYATGQLVLWSKDPALINGTADILRRGSFDKLAMANPKVAPYGAAAFEVLNNLGLGASLEKKLVLGESIGQTYQFIMTQNAALGFVALSQVQRDGRILEGSAWRVPANLHQPIRQDAILLQAGKNNPAAAALLAYLQGDKAKSLIRSFGYLL